jgi:hypothetical protein
LRWDRLRSRERNTKKSSPKNLEEKVATWRQTFETLLILRPEWQKRQMYAFGRGATETQLTQVETELAVRLPDDLREMLREFNGVWRKDEQRGENGPESEILILNTDGIIDAHRHVRTCGNPMPPDKELRKVVFIAQSNGYADLYGLCLEQFRRFPAGAVVFLDHDEGKFRKGYQDLRTLLVHGPK